MMRASDLPSGNIDIDTIKVGINYLFDQSCRSSLTVK
jgi:hypothetical protein